MQALRNVRDRLLAATGQAQRRPGVLFIGYAEGGLGLGQAFRGTLAAAAAADIPFAIYPFCLGIETRLIGPYMADRYDVAHAYEVSIVEAAADQLPGFFRTLGARLNKSYNILMTFWELPSAPEEWRENLVGIDEIWAPNEFVAKAFGSILPPAIQSSGDEHPGRAFYGMDESRFYFTFSFDYCSSPFRKNPFGVIEAFLSAFPTGQDNVGLVVKSMGAPELYPNLRAAIRDATNGDPRIMLIDEELPREQVLGLIRACDAYVSLHRAEGFGLGMVEAMSFGRIVIGTDYSGCTDFLTAQTGCPVPYALRPVLPDEYPYAEGQVWAEPDLDAAVDIMRNVVANPEESRRRAMAGRSLVWERYGAASVGRLMRARLAELQKPPADAN